MIRMHPPRSLALFVPPLAATLVLAVIGPFGTFTALAFPARLAFWAAIVPLNWLQTELVARWLSGRLKGAAMPVAASLLSAAPATAEVMVLVRWMEVEQTLGPASLYGVVAVLTVAISMVVWLIRRPPPLLAPADAAAPCPTPDTPFLRRIPPRLGRELLCLGTEDHYLRVYTPLGDDLILMRMRDAEDELAGMEGLRVHRSWWVARDAVRAIRRDGDRLALDLINGLSVPVSRANVAAVRAAGWRDISP